MTVAAEQSPITLADVRAASAAITAELNRRRWLVDPVSWVTERLQGDYIWSKQREIIESVRDNRLTAVPSSHQTGKSYISARVVGWWIDTHPPGEAMVVTTATSMAQVESVLWRELGRVHARGNLPGRMTLLKWHMVMPAGNEELVAFGSRPPEGDPTAFQGRHARYMLVVFDEAGGIEPSLWDAALSLIGNTESRMLAIGNPDYAISQFAEVCKPNAGWNVIPISTFDTPNFTGEHVPQSVREVLVSESYVTDAKRQWGESNPLYQSKVLGKFPAFDVDGLIPMPWIMRAQDNYATFSAEDSLPIELGVDVGGGTAKNVIALRRGRCVRIVHEDTEADTTKTADRVLEYISRFGATVARIDAQGIGRGASDQLKKKRAPVVGIEVGSPAKDTAGFMNLRAEGYWNLRELFQDEMIAIDPDDDLLASQLVDLKYESTNGRIVIESKRAAKQRGKKSPDRADAVMLAMMRVNRRRVSPVWGR